MRLNIVTIPLAALYLISLSAAATDNLDANTDRTAGCACDASSTDAQGPTTSQATLPFIRIDRDAGLIDLEAVVVLRRGDWVELVACSPGSKEHESILTVAARPSHVHLALLLLGLEPGAPMHFASGATADAPVAAIAPEGPPVHVSVIVPTEDGAPAPEIPVTRWILDRTTGQPLPDLPFRFTGSRLVPINGRDRYLADLHGTVISLVNFGDEVMARPTDLTNANDQAALQANTDTIPPLATPVILRLRPVELAQAPAANPPASQPATQPASAR